jgi:uncharacterized membrane protein YccC
MERNWITALKIAAGLVLALTLALLLGPLRPAR